MSDLLSSEEIDTLLQLFRVEGGDGGEVAGAIAVHAGSASPVDVESVDLLAPSRISHGELGVLDRLLGETARSIGAELARQVHRQLRGECQSVEPIRFATWRAEFKPPSLWFEIGLEPLRQPALLELPGGFVRSLVESSLGGDAPTAGAGAAAAGTFSEVELAVVEGIVIPVADRLAITLRTLAPVSSRLLCTTADPALLSRAPQPDELVLAALLRISGGGVDHSVRLALPHAELDPLLLRDMDARRGAAVAGRGRMRPQLTRALRDAPLEVKVELGRTKSTLRKLLALRPGDVLATPVRVGSAVEVRVGNSLKLHGVVGRDGGARALRVTAVVTDEPLGGR